MRGLGTTRGVRPTGRGRAPAPADRHQWSGTPGPPPALRLGAPRCAGAVLVGVCALVGPARANRGECPWYNMGVIGPARAVRGVLCGRTARARPGRRGGRRGRGACPGTHTGPNRGVLYRRQAPGRPPGGTKKEGRPKPPPLPIVAHRADLVGLRSVLA